MTTFELTSPTSDVDLFSDAVLADSLPIYQQLQELGPVVHLPTNSVYAVTQYAEVRDALADPETYSSTAVAFNPTMNEILSGTSLASDPPQHTQLRSVLSENLTPRAVRGMGDSMRTKAGELVESLVAAGSFDGMDDLARPFVTSIVMDLIGVQGEVREKMLGWGEAAFNLLGPMNDRAQAGFPTAGELFEWTHQKLTREDLSEGSMGRAVFDAAARGDIPADSAGAIVHQYIAAGMDTTITAIGNAVVLLGRYPEQYQALRSDLTLALSAFAEVQRYFTPMPVVGRRATREITGNGFTIPEGSQVALLLGAANRDPRHYEDPEIFDIRRNPVDHVAFGYGIHSCAGQGLARLEVQAVLQALAAKVSSYRITEVSPRLNNMTRPFDTISVDEVVGA